MKVIETNEKEKDGTTCKESSLKQQQQPEPKQPHNDDSDVVEDNKGIKHNTGRTAIFTISSKDNDNSAATTNSSTNYGTHLTSSSNQASPIITDDTLSVDNSTLFTTSTHDEHESYLKDQASPIILEDTDSISTSKHQGTSSITNSNQLVNDDVNAHKNATNINKKRVASPEPPSLCTDAKRRFLSKTENNEESTKNIDGCRQLGELTSFEDGGKSDLLVGDDEAGFVQLDLSSDSTASRDEKPSSIYSEIDLTKEAVVIIEPLDNFEVMLDDPSTADEISFDGTDNLSLPLSATVNTDNIINNKNSDLGLRTEDPASGANSPFTDSLFNIVAEHDENNEQQLDNINKDADNPSVVERTSKTSLQLQNVNNDESLANDIKNVPSDKQTVMMSSTHSSGQRQQGKTVYLSMTDDSGTDDDKLNNDEAIKQDVTKKPSSVSSKSETRRSTRFKHINTDNFF